MKKILAFVLTLAMMLTLLNVGFISTAAKTADGPIVTITDQATVTVDGTEYTVVDALPTTAGNYILKQDVVAEAGYTFPAGVVLHGNGYTITLEGNAVETPATEAPFILPAGTSTEAASVTITNVNFGTATAPIYLLANESKTDEDLYNETVTIVKDMGLFANDGVNSDFVEGADGAVTEGLHSSNYSAVAFDHVTFNVSITAVAGDANIGGVMGTVYGTHTLTNCTMNATINAGDAYAAASAKYGYAGLYYGRMLRGASITMGNCVTTTASVITNNYTCGGFIGEASIKTPGRLALTACSNYGKVSAADAAVGGLIGWINPDYTNAADGQLLVLDSLTNYGDIYSTIAVANEGAGGILGHMYYNKQAADTTTDADIVFNNCVNYGNIYTHGYAGGILCMTRIGSKAGFEKGSTTLNNCINYGIIEDTRQEANGGGVQCLKGGMMARAWGTTFINNCANYGAILEGDKDVGTGDQIGGLIGGTWAIAVPENYTNACVTLIGCANYGSVMTARRIGGFAGTGEINMYFENCVNYGTVGDATGPVGGFVGYNYPNGWQSENVFVNCVNYGSATDADTVGGFLGNSSNVSFENCINLADFDATGNAGGFVGWHFNGGKMILKNCANVGGALGYGSGSGGNIVGNIAAINTFEISNFLSYGIFTEFTNAPKLGGLVGCNTTFVPTEGANADFYAEVLADEEPDVADVDLVWQDSAEDAAAKINAKLADLGLAQTVYATEDNTLMVVNPMLRGVQTSEIKDGKVDVRILGAVDGNLPFYDGVIGREYDTVYLNYKVVNYSAADSWDDLMDRIEAATASQVDMLLYEEINNVIGYNELLDEKEIETITNYDMAAQFISGGVIRDVEVTTADDQAIVIIANMTTVLNGEEYDTATYMFFMMYGEVIMIEPYVAAANA